MIILAYLLVSFIVCIILVNRDFKRESLLYALIILIGVFGSIVFEYPLIMQGLWTHNLQPQILGVSWFAILMYIPFVTISYRIGKYLATKTRKNQYLFHFIMGIVLGFIIDSTSTSLGFYSYGFDFPLRVFNTPLGITLAEGMAIAIAIFIGKTLEGLIKTFLPKRPAP